MTSFHHSYRIAQVLFIMLFTLLVSAGVQLFKPATAEAVTLSESTMVYDLMKKLSDPHPTSLTADQFTFNIVGISASNTPISHTNISLTAFTVDTATAVVNLPKGTYTISENGPLGFVPGEWTIQWSNAKGCIQQSGASTTIVINDSNFGLNNVGCRADNQWRHGNLRVVKEFVGTSSPFENFSFKVSQDTNIRYEGVFDATDGENEVIIAAGTYKVEEATSTNYTATYSGDCASDGTGNMAQGGSQTCIVTNTYNVVGTTSSSTGTIVIAKQTNPDGDLTSFVFNPSWSDVDFSLKDGEQSTTTGLVAGTYSIVETLPVNWTQTSAVCSDGSPVSAISLGANETVTCVFTNTLSGGGGDIDTYRIEGYVWHDDNENAEWDGFGNQSEEEEVMEESQLGWVVNITNGSTTLSTTTDSNGFYYFEVPAGTWTITEVVQEGWTLITPASGSFVVTVPSATPVVPVFTRASFLEKVISFLIPTTYAAVIETFGPYNFGNNESTGGGGGGGGGGGISSGGIPNFGGGGGSLANPTPEPQVLGVATTTVMPIGAPNTGAGGTAKVSNTFALVLLFTFGLSLVVNRLVRNVEQI